MLRCISSRVIVVSIAHQNAECSDAKLLYQTVQLIIVIRVQHRDRLAFHDHASEPLRQHKVQLILKVIVCPAEGIAGDHIVEIPALQHAVICVDLQDFAGIRHHPPNTRGSVDEAHLHVFSFPTRLQATDKAFFLQFSQNLFFIV